MAQFLGILGTRLARLGKFCLGVARSYGPTTSGAAFSAPIRKTDFKVFPRCAFEVPVRKTDFKVPIEN